MLIASIFSLIHCSGFKLNWASGDSAVAISLDAPNPFWTYESHCGSFEEFTRPLLKSFLETIKLLFPFALQDGWSNIWVIGSIGSEYKSNNSAWV